MILKYTALIFLVFGSMIFTAYCIPIGASDQATQEDWKTTLLNSAGKDVNINALTGSGLIDENTPVESSLVDETQKTISDNFSVSSKDLGELEDDNSSGNLILNATNATDITQYIADTKFGN